MSNLPVHTICPHLDQGYATFTVDIGGDIRRYALAFSPEGGDNIVVQEPQMEREVWATDSTGSCFLYTDDPWYADHTKAYVLRCDQWDWVASGEYFVRARSGELVPYSQIEADGRLDSIGYDWDGMGVEYVGADFLTNYMGRIDFTETGIALFLKIGD